MRTSSSFSPLYDSAITTSSRRITPRSPCSASAGCRKNAGVPVLDSVAAILRQTMPDLPIPVRITRPPQPPTRATARANRSSRRSASASTAAASVCSTLRASDKSVMRLDDPIKRDQPPQQRFEARQVAGRWRRRSSHAPDARAPPGTPRPRRPRRRRCASGSMNSACPPVTPSPAPGSCRLCVTSKTTGWPNARSCGRARMSTTRLW